MENKYIIILLLIAYPVFAGKAYRVNDDFYGGCLIFDTHVYSETKSIITKLSDTVVKGNSVYKDLIRSYEEVSEKIKNKYSSDTSFIFKIGFRDIVNDNDGIRSNDLIVIATRTNEYFYPVIKRTIFIKNYKNEYYVLNLAGLSVRDLKNIIKKISIEKEKEGKYMLCCRMTNKYKLWHR